MTRSIEDVRRNLAQAQKSLRNTPTPSERDRELFVHLDRTVRIATLAAITLNERTSRG